MKTKHLVEFISLKEYGLNTARTFNKEVASHVREMDTGQNLFTLSIRGGSPDILLLTHEFVIDCEVGCIELDCSIELAFACKSSKPVILIIITMPSDCMFILPKLFRKNAPQTSVIPHDEGMGILWDQMLVTDQLKPRLVAEKVIQAGRAVRDFLK